LIQSRGSCAVRVARFHCVAQTGIIIDELEQLRAGAISWALNDQFLADDAKWLTAGVAPLNVA
jgi:hypothetical protein